MLLTAAPAARLQAKFKRFQQMDIKKYEAVSKMHADDAVALAKRVLTADRLLHEQQLGWVWNPPAEAVFQPPAEEAATQAAAQAEAADEENSAEAKAAQLAERLEDPRSWGALDLLCDEAGFLVDGKARALVDKLPKSEQGSVQVKAILGALGIDDGPSFDALLAALSDSPAAALPGQPPALVDPIQAVARLKTFLETHRNSVWSGSRAVASPSASAAASRQQAAEARDKEFWERLANVVDDRVYRVWNALEGQLGKYQVLLSQRASGLREVESLQLQNTELRALLNQYLSSRINTELKIPPTQII